MTLPNPTRSLFTPVARIVVANHMLLEACDQLPTKHELYYHKVKYLSKNLTEQLLKHTDNAYRALKGKQDADHGLSHVWNVCQDAADNIARMSVERIAVFGEIMRYIAESDDQRLTELIALIAAHRDGEVRIEN
jgi:hypothetical protein